MDDTHQPANNPMHSKSSLPTIDRSIPGEIAALPASTRTSFTRVDLTRPGSAAGDNSCRDEEMAAAAAAAGAVSDEGGSGSGGADPCAQPGDEQGVETGAVVVPQVPQTLVQFLLVSGRRRSMAFDPETTVGRVKELVWNTWPNGTFTFTPSLTHFRMRACPPTRTDTLFPFSFIYFYQFWLICGLALIDGRVPDWQDEHPPAPSYLRILYLGKILQDDETLARTCAVCIKGEIVDLTCRLQSSNFRLIHPQNLQRPR